MKTFKIFYFISARFGILFPYILVKFHCKRHLAITVHAIGL